MPDQTNPELTTQEFTITRELDAPRELVWSALTDPEQIIKFWGPVGTTVPLESVSIDPRPGGRFNLTMVLIDESQEFPMDATFKEFVELECMVFETAGGITGTIQLTDLGDGRTKFEWTTRAAFDEDLLKNAKL